jgi:hypothetical protein
MQFWCKAEATAWTWGWTAYVGVWGFIVLLVRRGRRVEPLGGATRR